MTPSSKTAADDLKNDPRIMQAKKLLLETVEDHKQLLTSVRPAQASLVESYKDTLRNFSEVRGGNLYFPYIGSGLGNGPLVELLDGSVKYDMISGIGPHFWGHSLKALIEVSIDAALCDTIMQGHLQQNIDGLLYSNLLLKASGMDHCFLSSSGAMANENALKLAFHKKYPANRVLAFDHCFMGRTLALSQITDKPSFREGLPQSLMVDYIPFYDSSNPYKSTEASLTCLKEHISRYPGKHAVMCFELVQGEGGFNTGDTDFFKAIMTVLKEHNIAIFIDEIQTFGRTPALFAFQYYQLEDFVDIVSIGKLSQVCATLFKAPFKPKPGLLSQTFTSSTAALRASIWVLQSLVKDHFYGSNGKIEHLHATFLKHFQRLEDKFLSNFCGPYGIGAMIAFTPFQGDPKKVSQFVQDLFLAGVIAFTAGQNPMRVRFLIPAAVMEDKDVAHVMAIVEEVMEQHTKSQP